MHNGNLHRGYPQQLHLITSSGFSRLKWHHLSFWNVSQQLMVNQSISTVPNFYICLRCSVFLSNWVSFWEEAQKCSRYSWRWFQQNSPWGWKSIQWKVVTWCKGTDIWQKKTSPGGPAESRPLSVHFLWCLFHDIQTDKTLCGSTCSSSCWNDFPSQDRLHSWRGGGQC